MERSLASNGEGAIFVAETRRRSFGWRCCRGILSMMLLLVIIAGAGFVLLRGGINSDLLRQEAQRSLSSMLGESATASIAGAAISFSQDSHIALEAQDVSIIDPVRGIDIKGIRSVRLGLSPLPLVVGNVEVAQLELEGADIRLPDGKDGGLLDALPLDDKGLIDFDAVSAEIFAAIRDSVGLLDQRETRSIGIFDSTIRFLAKDAEQSVNITRALIYEKAGDIRLEGEFIWQGHSIALDGSVERRVDDKVIDNFQIAVRHIPLNLGSPPEVAPVIGDDRVNPAHFKINGTANLLLKGHTAQEGKPEHLTAKFEVDNIDMEFGRTTDMKGQVQLQLDHIAGSGKIEINPSQITLGGMQVVFNGAFGPEPKREPDGTVSDGKAAYRFEILTSSATSKPGESTDPAVSFATRISGRFVNESKQLQFANLDVKTDNGELYGQGNMTFGGGSPEMIFLLRIPKMPVADAKHLWPINVADGARSWVLKNLFGGTLLDGKIDVTIAAGYFNGPDLPPPLTGDQIKVDMKVTGTRFDVVGELPAVRDATGTVSVRGAHTTINLESGTVFTPDNRQASVSDATLVIPWGPQRPVIAELDMTVSGDAAAIAEIVDNKPIDVLNRAPFTATEITGNVDARVHVGFAISKNPPPNTLVWNADIGFSDIDIAQPIDGSLVTQAKGRMTVDQATMRIETNALLSGIPAKITMAEPVGPSSKIKREQTIVLEMDDKTRARALPGLNAVFSGPMSVSLGMKKDGKRRVEANLAKTQIHLPWLGWQKGAGIAAKATFDLIIKDNDSGNIQIQNLDLVGEAFRVSGSLAVANKRLQSINFDRVKLNRNDDLSVKVAQASGGYRVTVRGSSYDARALLKHVSNLESNSKTQDSLAGNARIVVDAHIDNVSGFNDESLSNVAVSYETAGAKLSGVSVNATTSSGKSFVATLSSQNGARSISMQSTDAGAVLRFFDYYAKMQGGKITVGLASQGDAPLSGQIDARNFSIVNEPKLASIVSNPPTSGGTSLNQAVKRDIDVSRVDFERGYALVEKGEGYVKLAKGVVRGPLIGSTFQGTLYDGQGNMAMTGTFMPAYGLNRLFAELPILGALLGNGRDRGLIGITYKLSGDAKKPHVTVNPISVIAPGIFRSIFEFQ